MRPLTPNRFIEVARLRRFALSFALSALAGCHSHQRAEDQPSAAPKIDGDKIVLEVAVGEKGTIHFELKADGDGLKGTVELRRTDGTESGTVILKKAT